MVRFYNYSDFMYSNSNIETKKEFKKVYPELYKVYETILEDYCGDLTFDAFLSQVVNAGVYVAKNTKKDFKELEKELKETFGDNYENYTTISTTLDNKLIWAFNS